jgi:hypothetical protein
MQNAFSMKGKFKLQSAAGWGRQRRDAGAPTVTPRL